MDMAGDHADGPLWGAGYLHAPQFVRKILKEKLGHSVIGSPSGQQVVV